MLTAYHCTKWYSCARNGAAGNGMSAITGVISAVMKSLTAAVSALDGSRTKQYSRLNTIAGLI
jgi:hypothetical protein